MKDFIKKYWFLILFILLGGLAGFLYWHFVGCNSGTCAITSKWQNSTVLGGIFGYLIGSTIKKDNKVKEEQKENAG